jgi:hypothetical protein
MHSKNHACIIASLARLPSPTVRAFLSPRLSHAPTTVFSPSLRPPASSPSPASTSSPSHASSSPVRFLSPNGSPFARAHWCTRYQKTTCVYGTRVRIQRDT